MVEVQTDTYGKKEAEADYLKLAEFHEVVYQGAEVTQAYTTLAHEAWWRIAEYHKMQGSVPLEVMLTLLYTMKYLPMTFGEVDEVGTDGD